MAYAYQQNMFDGASYGYVKYNISPDLGTVVSPGTTITITGQAYFKNRAKLQRSFQPQERRSVNYGRGYLPLILREREYPEGDGHDVHPPLPDVGIVRRLGKQPCGQRPAQLHALVGRKC
jgi:hypothetical protein